VAQAKRYREWAQDNGHFKTLAEKAQDNPEVEKLKGAVDIYIAGGALADLGDFATMLKSMGIDRAVINAMAKSGGAADPDALPEDMNMADAIDEAIREGFIISYYDIYTDLPPMEPEYPWYNSPTYSCYSYPEDTIKDAWGGGEPVEGWYTVYDDEGQAYTCSVVTPQRRLSALKDFMPTHLQIYPSNAHFLDCEAKAWLFEDWDSNHPVDRRDDLNLRSQMLSYLSDDLGLIAGSEGGVFWAVPYLHYTEDMMSVSHYWANPVPGGLEGPIHYDLCPDYLRYELGHDVRIPLWELVFHDCLLTSFRWSMGNLRDPANMWKMDLFNLLYGTTPLWMIMDHGMSLLVGEPDRLAASYEMVCNVNRFTQFDELLDHEFLSEDGALQRTTWSSGLTITVNFNETHSYETLEGDILPPGSYLLSGNLDDFPGLPIGQVMDAYEDWVPAPESERLFVNGGFEEASLATWFKSGAVEAEIISNDTRSGSGALRINGLQNRGWTYVNAPVGSLKPGQDYRISLWMKVLQCPRWELDHPGPEFVSLQDETKGEQLTWNFFDPQAMGDVKQGEWTQYELILSLPETHNYGFLHIGRRNQTEGGAIFLLDDILIEPFTEPGPEPEPEFPPLPPLPPILSNLAITPTEIESGDEITISLDVENSDSQSFTYTVTMQIGDLTLLIDVELGAYESKTVSRTITQDTPGDFIVTVDGLTGSFTVKTPPKPAELEFSDLRIFYPGVNPPEVEAGQTVTVTVSIEAENVGELEGGRTVELNVDGEMIDSKEVTLEGGASSTVLFELTRGEGTYEVEVEGFTESFTVNTKPEPEPRGIPGFPNVSIVLGLLIALFIHLRNQS